MGDKNRDMINSQVQPLTDEDGISVTDVLAVKIVEICKLSLMVFLRRLIGKLCHLLEVTWKLKQ